VLNNGSLQDSGLAGVRRLHNWETQTLNAYIVLYTHISGMLKSIMLALWPDKWATCGWTQRVDVMHLYEPDWLYCLFII